MLPRIALSSPFCPAHASSPAGCPVPRPAGRGSARKLSQVTPTGILYSSKVKDLSDLINDDAAAEAEAAAQVRFDAGRLGRAVLLALPGTS